MLLANDSVNTLFGQVTPPQGMLDPGLNPQTTISTLLGKGIALFVTAASLVLLIFLLWGAMDWILSGGEKDKIAKAQSKLTNAVIGFILIFVMLGVFGVITGDILGIVKKSSDGSWTFSLPTLGSTNPGGGDQCPSPNSCVPASICAQHGHSGGGICSDSSLVCCNVDH